MNLNLDELRLEQSAERSCLAPEVEADVADFEREAARFATGEADADIFTSFRTMRGVYAQRQDGFYMVRVKIPLGRLTAPQAERLAEVSEAFARGWLHVTTRQDMELHWVRLEKIPEVMRRLGEVGLTTREACGNAVRNVTACPLAGLCPYEAFDVTPFALATAQYFLRHPLVQALPRKFKIAFSGCRRDCAFAAIHDVGAMAVVRRHGGVVEKGFRVVVGGGLGPVPRRAELLDEFLPAGQFLVTCEAVLRVFNRLGERRNRNLARLKFLVRRLGIDEFRRLVNEERGFSTPVTDTPEQSSGAEASDVGLGADVLRQRQPGYVAKVVRLPQGNIGADQLRAVAAAARQFGHAELRTTRDQNLLIPWVQEATLDRLLVTLQQVGLAEEGAGRAVDITTCPGAEVCRVGITRSMALARALERALEREGLADVPGVRIKIGGCPHACGHHHVASIGLYGGAVRVGDRHVPCYTLLVRGGVDETGARFGRPVGRIPAKLAVEAVVTLVRLFRQQQAGADGSASSVTFDRFLQQLPPGTLQTVLAPFTAEPPSYEEAPELYVDWGTGLAFTLEGRLEGECAR